MLAILDNYEVIWGAENELSLPSNIRGTIEEDTPLANKFLNFYFSVPHIDYEFVYDNQHNIIDVVEPKETKIEQLKQELADGDYKIIKCYEASLTNAEMPYNVAELVAERNAIRAEINELEEEE